MSSSPILSTRLAHSLNSRGEFGSFVDPSSCSCVTCSNYTSALSQDGVLQSASSAPSPLPSGSGTGAGASVGLTRSYTSQDWVTMETTVSQKSAVPSLPPPTALARSNAYVEKTLEEEEEDVLKSLARLRATYRLRQDKVYEEEATRHDEMAMADQEWSELDEKIAAIESLLSRFRYPFRTR